MRVVVIGGDGYCGWATALHLSQQGYDVAIYDNLIRRRWDKQLGIDTLTPIHTIHERIDAWERYSERRIIFHDIDVTNYETLHAEFARTQPDAIVNFGQQRSAPYSMIDRDHAAETLINNTLGNLNVLWAIRSACPHTHLVKLGTMGEYGTPNIEIEEGFITIEHKGRTDTLPFPKQPGSFYHLTKVADSDQIAFVCRSWGLRATDLNQGIVYGLVTPETELAPELVNRFDYDGIYGTVLNRFCVQAALEHPLTVYGKGGQTRTFLDIRDTVRCIELAIATPPATSEYRVFNQFTEIFSVLELAHRVERAAKELGFRSSVQHLDNPRAEKEVHYYSSINQQLLSLGLQPHLLDDETIISLIRLAYHYRDRIEADQILTSVRWRDHSSGSQAAPESAVSASDRS